MTEGADETAVVGTEDSSQGSTGSTTMDDIMRLILQEKDENPTNLSLPQHGPSSAFANTATMAEISELLDLNSDGSGPAGVPPQQPHQNFIKQEQNTEERSPDSGYQPPSNGSIDLMIPNIVEELPVSRTTTYDTPTQKKPMRMCEIEPQPLIVPPPRSNYVGDYAFRISFEKRDAVPKNINCTHSYSLNKLFVKMETPCPVTFHCSRLPPENSMVRGMLLYVDDVHETVSRCHNHRAKEANDRRSDLSHHVLQTAIHSPYHNQCFYDTSKGRHSVVVPYVSPALGDDGFMIQYKFTCLTTCVGGINRRSMLAVFTLEDAVGNVLGRACVEVKVCTCPGRDRPKDEERKKRAEKPTGSVVSVPLPKKRATAREEGTSVSAYKYLKVRRENFEFISHINDVLNLSAMVSDEQRSQYYEDEQQHRLAEQLAKFCKD